MPYPNVPSALTGKMDSCVKGVMKDGKDKKQAIAICYSQVVGKAVNSEARKRAGRK